MKHFLKGLKKDIQGLALRYGLVVQSKRQFESALSNRLTNDWVSASLATNEDIRNNLVTLRNRSRDLEQNNDYMRKFFAGLQSNVIGHSGIGVQSKAKDTSGSLDTVANDLIEAEWKQWGKRKNCTVNGRFSWRGVQRMVLRSVARDGDCFVRKIINSSGLRLQLIEGDRLDVNHNVHPKNGQNEIVMGVEIDSLGTPVAYHVMAQSSTTSGMIQSRKERVPANQIIHVFIPDRITQNRGLPWVMTAMKRLKMLGGYEEAELIAARVAASKMGFLTKERPEGYTGETNEAGQPFMDVEAGAIEELPMGVSFQSWNPEHPAGNYAPFIKAMLRGVSSGLGVSYNMLANDLEGVNFSSIRAGVLDEREIYKEIQQWLIETFIEPVFEEWLEVNLLNGRIGLPFSKFDKFNAPEFKPRRWPWVDPEKDLKAQKLAIDNLLTSRRAVIAETGGDIEDVFRDQEQDSKLADKYGLTQPEDASSGDD